jgi:hypothetical protein
MRFRYVTIILSHGFIIAYITFDYLESNKSEKEADVKKFLRIMEGLAINIGSWVFAYFMLYLFYFLFCSQNKLMPIEIF